MPERYLEETAEQLRASLAAGLLFENSHTDFKRELGTGRAANGDLAIDLASFGIHGGRVYIGVVDEKQRPPPLHPIALSGLAERIDQVARTRIQPPLHIRCHEILDADASAGHGYLVVIVPPSPYAPHQVDGKYRGRGDKTNRVLPDAEVRELLAARRRVDEDGEARLAVEMQRDPTLSSGANRFWHQAHLFVMADPVFGDRELLHAAIPDGDWESWLRSSIREGMGRRLTKHWEPDMGSYATQTSRRADGWALHSTSLPQNRRPDVNDDQTHEKDMLELEINEDGSVRLFCGAGSAYQNNVRVLFPELIAGLTWRALEATATVAKTARYYGPWDLGLGLSNMRNVQAFPPHRGPRSAPLYSKDEYRQTARVTYEQLTGDRDALLHRLVGRLARSLVIPFGIAEVTTP